MKGMVDVADIIKHGESSAVSNELLHTSLIQVESTEASWGDNFAKPLLAKRHQVDSGDATVSDLQIFYLQKDPTSWLLKSSSVLDQAATEIAKSLDETSKSAAHASTLSTTLTTGGTFLALVWGFVVAYYTAKSITEPLTHLITVAREIGDSGDLDQGIDIHRNDEIGALINDHLQQHGRLLKKWPACRPPSPKVISPSKLSRVLEARYARQRLRPHATMACRISSALITRRLRRAEVSAGPNQVAGAASTSPQRSASRLPLQSKKSTAPCTK